MSHRRGPRGVDRGRRVLELPTLSTCSKSEDEGDQGERGPCRPQRFLPRAPDRRFDGGGALHSDELADLFDDPTLRSGPSRIPANARQRREDDETRSQSKDRVVGEGCAHTLGPVLISVIEGGLEE